MFPLILCLLSFIPSIILFIYFLHLKTDEDYRDNCKKIMVRGLLSVIGVFFASLISRIIYNLLLRDIATPVIADLYTCFVTNAICEEGVKFYSAYSIFKDKKSTLCAADLIVFLIISAMGFGISEDLVYAFGTTPGQIIVRGLLIAHGSLGAIMGTLYAASIRKHSIPLRILAFVVPIIMHGTYNFGLKDTLPDWSGMVSLLITVCEFIFLIRTIIFLKKHKDDPEYQNPLYPALEEQE